MYLTLIQRRRKAAFFCLPLIYLAIANCASASSPWRPASDSEVLETLPQQFLQGREQLRALHQRLAKQPNNDRLALRLATLYRNLGDSQGDPRYYGYARAVLQPWWNSSDATIEILALRAKLKEKNHEYAGARADLTLLLEQDRGNIQAWVDNANIARVQGDFAAARQSCEAIKSLASAQTLAICRLPQMLVTGQAQAAHDKLGALLPSWQGEQWQSVAAWGWAVRAEAARALGKDQLAEQHFVDGLKASPDDAYLLRGYGELLLDLQRPQDVMTLLRDQHSDNGALLLYALAAKQSGKEVEAKQSQQVLRQRFEELKLRGDEPHGRYEARYQLELLNQPQVALEVAQANWQRQKEIADARILLMAAVAQGDKTAAEPVLAFMQQHNTQNAILQRLVEELP